MRNFIVASHGQTATAWFAEMLDMHPRINCSHGYYHPTLFATDPRFKALPGPERRRVTVERFFKLSLNDYLAELNKAGRRPWPWQRPFNGSVHCFTAGMMFHHLKSHRPPGLVWMNMIRNPVQRVNSVAAHWRTLLESDALARDHLLNIDFPAARHIADPVSARYDVDFSDAANAMFVTALLQLQHINIDLERCIQEDIPVITAERLVSDRAYFAEIVGRLTRGAIPITSGYLDQVFAAPRTNRHRSPGAQETWADWQWHAYQVVMDERTRGLYRSFGYE